MPHKRFLGSKQKKRFSSEKNRHLSKFLDILRLYASDYSGRLNGREIARKLGVNHQTALNKINMLVKLNILSFKAKAQMKEYTLNINNYTAKMMMVMSEYAASINALNTDEINVIIPEMSLCCEGLILFGSFASCKYDERSDIDIVCIGKFNKEQIDKIRQRCAREINVHYVTWKELVSALNQRNALAVEILGNHKLFGEVSKIVDIFWKWYYGRR